MEVGIQKHITLKHLEILPWVFKNVFFKLRNGGKWSKIRCPDSLCYSEHQAVRILQHWSQPCWNENSFWCNWVPPSVCSRKYIFLYRKDAFWNLKLKYMKQLYIGIQYIETACLVLPVQTSRSSLIKDRNHFTGDNMDWTKNLTLPLNHSFLLTFMHLSYVSELYIKTLFDSRKNYIQNVPKLLWHNPSGNFEEWTNSY